MAKLYILKEGEPGLRKTCRPVTDINLRTKRLLDDMVETMRKADGVGLAAPQVGVLRRVVVIEVEEGVTYEMINPEVIDRKGEQIETEGCLSVPGRWGTHKRPAVATVRYMDREGNIKELTGDGLLARAICHETDHLEGKLFIDEMIKEIKADD